ncbi:GntR family transcriptional regulator [Clostridium sp. P21]|uniref:GntR family transcriptional regulator n=1 Tax=Clostridium muellerianum TaxID=2716538 RepID=A0A7Y0EKB4_9CLOT|nr:GntR family transcriptional regulator [Clostridium muellerianum]NMM64000.1 GntR family transcriptional regulator [Clostridium muellerianum]
MPIPKDYLAPVTLSAKEKALKQIQEWIIDGTFAPGERINDTELSKVLGISRTPVREALQILKIQEFVEMKPGKETIVTQIQHEDILLILPPVSVLHALASEIAIDRIDNTFIKGLKEINEVIRRDIINKDFHSAIKHDADFHFKIVKAAENKYIENMVTMMQAHVRRFFFHESLTLSKQCVMEHEKIIEAFQNRDKDLVSKYTKLNWRSSIDEFYKDV